MVGSSGRVVKNKMLTPVAETFLCLLQLRFDFHLAGIECLQHRGYRGKSCCVLHMCFAYESAAFWLQWTHGGLEYASQAFTERTTSHISMFK